MDGDAHTVRYLYAGNHILTEINQGSCYKLHLHNIKTASICARPESLLSSAYICQTLISDAWACNGLLSATSSHKSTVLTFNFLLPFGFFRSSSTCYQFCNLPAKDPKNRHPEQTALYDYL
jgi:hypothetical protein